MIDKNRMVTVACLLFEDFEALDLFGPVEFLSGIETIRLCYLSLEGGLVKSRQDFQIQTERGTILPANSILLLVGGRGVRKEVANPAFLQRVQVLAEQADLVLSVCTGAAFLAKSGLLDGHSATSNKRAWDWVTSLGSQVLWKRQARWVSDGKYYSSSGVSAGMDMTLGVIADIWGQEQSETLAHKAEYIWHQQADSDPFA